MGHRFDDELNKSQVDWRDKHVQTQEQGSQNGTSRPWILPADMWEEGLWPGIRSGTEHAVEAHTAKCGVQKHPGVHNLKSSWMLGANLYFSHRRAPQLLAKFLAEHIDDRIVDVQDLQLEWAEDPPLDPTTLLGEPEGRRGANQTSPDIGIVVVLKGGGRGLVLTEVKLVEHSFYPCSGRNKKYGNPDASRCLDAKAVIDNPALQCHLTSWETNTRKNRRYWDYIKISDAGRQTLQRCPAAYGGYQLFRQQALAEAIARSGKYDLVASAVAFDARNDTLVRSMRSTGIGDFTEDWGALFTGQARFGTFTHQAWVRWVHEHDENGLWHGWLDWVCERYGYRLR